MFTEPSNDYGELMEHICCYVSSRSLTPPLPSRWIDQWIYRWINRVTLASVIKLKNQENPTEEPNPTGVLRLGKSDRYNLPSINMKVTFAVQPTPQEFQLIFKSYIYIFMLFSYHRTYFY